MNQRVKGKRWVINKHSGTIFVNWTARLVFLLCIIIIIIITIKAKKKYKYVLLYMVLSNSKKKKKKKEGEGLQICTLVQMM